MPGLSRNRAVLRTVIESLRRFGACPSDLSELLSVQRRLTRCLANVERRIASYKLLADRLRTTIRQHRLSRDESADLKKQLTAYQKKIKHYQWLLFIFRTVGDGLAFSVFDRWDLKPLACREAPGWISRKKGARLESSILRAVIATGTPAIRSDLTNVLRYADIAVALDGTIGLIEAKSGRGRSSRDARQMTSIKKIADYLVTDTIQGLYGRPQIVRRAAHTEQVQHVGQLNVLIERSRGKDFAFADVEDGVRYAIVRRWEDSYGPQIFYGMRRPLVFGLNAAKNTCRWNGYYPFTLSIHDLADLLDFIEDAFVILVVLDLEEAVSVTASLGYEAKFIDGDPVFVLCCTLLELHRANVMSPLIMISRHFLCRVGFEFLSLRWLIEEALRPVAGIEGAFADSIAVPSGQPRGQF